MGDNFLEQNLQRIDAAISKARALRAQSDQARHKRSDVAPAPAKVSYDKYVPKPNQPRHAPNYMKGVRRSLAPPK